MPVVDQMLSYIDAEQWQLTLSKDTFARTLRRNEFENHISNFDPREEAGYDLIEEDILKFHVWPTGIIPYYIDDFSFDKVLRDRIRMFLNGVNRLTALHFVEIPSPPIDDETKWVLFVNRKGLLGCEDHPFDSFTNAGVQKVVLGYHCMNSDENLADVVLSLVGVPPQHNAPDRKDYITVIFKNIIPDKTHLFEKLKDTEWLFHDLMYDYQSAGHYGLYKHTSNGKVTVKRKHDDSSIPNPSKPKEKGFSQLDFLKIALLYNYITRHRETPVPECSKLFVPGSNTSDLSLLKDPIMKPRKKPNLYLGKSEIKQDLSIEENSNTFLDDIEGNDSQELYNDNSNNIVNKKTVSNLNYKGDTDNSDSINEYGTVKSLANDKTNSVMSDNGDDVGSDSEGSNEKNEERYINAIYETDKKDNVNKNEKNRDGNTKNEGKYLKGEKKKSEKISADKVEDVTTSSDTVNTTRKKDYKPLVHQIENLNKTILLGQSDYETDDQGKNKYVHEKNM